MDEKRTVTAKDYDNVIRATVSKALKYIGFGWNDYEDYVQQMWTEVLDQGEREKKPNNLPDLAEVPIICRRRMGDIFKKKKASNKRGQEIPTDMSVDFMTSMEDDFTPNQLITKNLKASINYIWPLLTTKEKEYLKYKLEKADIEDFGFHPPVNDTLGKTGPKDEYTDEWIAKYLGFPSGTSARFRRFRKEFQDKISDYLEI